MMWFHMQDNPMGNPLLDIDAEMLWPPVSARYNIALGDLTEVALTEETCDTVEEAVDRVAIYIGSLIFADSLWGQDVLDAMLSVDRWTTIRATTMSMEDSLDSCVGADTVELYRSIQRLVGRQDKQRLLAHNQLAAAMISWSWFGQGLDSVMTNMARYKKAIDSVVSNKQLDFPHPLFTTLVARSFNPSCVVYRPGALHAQTSPV